MKNIYILLNHKISMKKSNWLVIGILILVAIIILAFLYYKNTVGFSPTDEPPYALKWEIRLPQGVISTGHKGATLGDIDNDGDLEAVISLNGVPPELIALDNKGNRLWTITTPGYVVDNPALGDLDGDGDLEIVTASDNYLQARNGQGVLLWSFQTSPYYASIDGGPALADLDNDGRLEIVVGTIQTGMSANHGNTAYVLNYDGSLRWSYKFPAGNLSYQYGIQYANPVIEDLDGDGNFEILVASDEMLYSFDRNGNVDWTYNASKWEPSRISATPAVADFDSDGKKRLCLVLLQKISGWTFQTQTLLEI